MSALAKCVALLAVLVQASCGGGTAPVSAAPAVSTEAAAPSIEHFSIASAALGKAMAVAVYLPPNYSKAVRYPVLYMLHGFGGDQTAFFDYLALNRTADRLIAAGAIAPLIIVTPLYDNSFGVNTTVEQEANSGGGSIGRYEDYLIKEMLPYVESRYSTAGAREQRYVGGISMGGFAALYLGLRHPELFSKIGAHSAALWDYSAKDQFIGQRDWLYATPTLRALRDPMLLATTAAVRGLRFYLDVGSADGLRTEDLAMLHALQTAGAQVEWHEGPGGHDATYWRSQLESYLYFYN